jgi:beta-lactamase superfamily II metal-dependent hydrolase
LLTSTEEYSNVYSRADPALLLICTSSTDAFVAATRPAAAVVSVGRDSPYGHPHPEVLARWQAAGAQVLTTAERGMITVSTDGEDLKVETLVRPSGQSHSKGAAP